MPPSDEPETVSANAVAMPQGIRDIVFSNGRRLVPEAVGMGRHNGDIVGMDDL